MLNYNTFNQENRECHYQNNYRYINEIANFFDPFNQCNVLCFIYIWNIQALNFLLSYEYIRLYYIYLGKQANIIGGEIKVKKNLTDFEFSEIIDMKQEEFDSAMTNDKSSIGLISNLRNLLVMQYEENRITIESLTNKALSSDKSGDKETSDKCRDLISQLYGIQFGIEYKVCKIEGRIITLASQVNDKR